MSLVENETESAMAASSEPVVAKKVSFGKKAQGPSSDESHLVSLTAFQTLIVKGLDISPEMVVEAERESARKFRAAYDATQIELHKPIVQLKQSPERLASNQKGVGLFWFVVFSAIFASAFAYYLGTLEVSKQTDSVPKFDLLPIQSEIPTADKHCLPITPELYAKMKETTEWDQMHHSLQHFVNSGFPSFSAFRIGKPYCLMLTRTQGNETLIMANVEINGVSVYPTVSREEKSRNCIGTSKHVKRFRTVWIRYQDPTREFEIIERKIEDVGNMVQSFIFQSEFSYLNGLSICDGTDKGIESTLEIMREGKQY